MEFADKLKIRAPIQSNLTNYFKFLLSLIFVLHIHQISCFFILIVLKLFYLINIVKNVGLINKITLNLNMELFLQVAKLEKIFTFFSF